MIVLNWIVLINESDKRVNVLKKSIFLQQKLSVELNDNNLETVYQLKNLNPSISY